jgi:3-oxoacyl-[acyl-carrier protein] reductase
VVFGYRSDARAAETVVGQVAKAGGRARAVAADVADPDELEQVFTVADAHLGRLDVLVNNAALPGRTSLERVSAAQFDGVVAVNAFPPARRGWAQRT